MSYMFSSCYLLSTLDLSSFNTSNVTDMSYMFSNCNDLISLNITSFNTSNVTKMIAMFSYCESLTSINLSSFNTSNLTNMKEMFYYCKSLTTLDLSSFNTSNVTTMLSLFYNCNSLTSVNLSSFNTINVTQMSSMFYSCNRLTSLDLSTFDTSNVISMSEMFLNCASLRIVYVSNNWTTQNVNSSTNMFIDCRNLVGGLGTYYTSNHKDKEYARVDRRPTAPGYFTYKSAPDPGYTPTGDITGTLNYEEGNYAEYGGGSGYVAITRFFRVTGDNIINSLGGNNAFCLDPLQYPVSSGTVIGGVETTGDLRKLAYFLYGGPGWYDNTQTIKDIFTNHNITSDPDDPSRMYGYSHAMLSILYGGNGSDYGFTAQNVQDIIDASNEILALTVDETKYSNFHAYISDLDDNQDMLFWTYDEGSNLGKSTKRGTVEKSNNNNNNIVITFNSNGGSGEMNSETIDPSISNKLYSNEFKKIYYKFGGWNTMPDGTGEGFSNEQVIDANTLNDNITLYAIWFKDGWVFENEGETNLLLQKWSYYDNNNRIENGWNYLSNYSDSYEITMNYYYIKDGYMHLGWLVDDGKYYYLSTFDDDNDGFVDGYAIMNTTKVIDGVEYTFDDKGVCTNFINESNNNEDSSLSASIFTTKKKKKSKFKLPIDAYKLRRYFMGIY